MAEESITLMEPLRSFQRVKPEKGARLGDETGLQGMANAIVTMIVVDQMFTVKMGTWLYQLWS